MDVRYSFNLDTKLPKMGTSAMASAVSRLGPRQRIFLVDAEVGLVLALPIARFLAMSLHWNRLTRPRFVPVSGEQAIDASKTGFWSWVAASPMATGVEKDGNEIRGVVLSISSDGIVTKRVNFDLDSCWVSLGEVYTQSGESVWIEADLSEIRQLKLEVTTLSCYETDVDVLMADIVQSGDNRYFQSRGWVGKIEEGDRVHLERGYVGTTSADVRVGALLRIGGRDAEA
eukprot:CAMPEP_0196737350 /NCGR_PEP_ID=MMETSP1091-20130531/15112_1 /TAXON_ID=302021 /ORGANISM="Rhodomonas sp., Strain CCMP768" /LENGTH=228 /DNA_ID=CAMNT_0042081191 /DNA_START=75 /DNA_END=761 /DNA_ORIENTATION=-